MPENTSEVNYKRILLTWLPLAAMWIFMAVEQPAVTSFIARLPDPKRELAIFGAIFAISLIIESPIIQMLSAGTALANSQGNYRLLLRLMNLFAALMVCIHLTLALTPLWRLVIVRLVGLPEEFLENSRSAFLMMTPWASAVGYRRLWQGVLIRHGHSGIIPFTMLFRLLATLLCLGAGLWIRTIPGATAGALALSAGVTVGAVVTYLYLPRALRDLEESPTHMGMRKLLRFYLPLILTAFVNLSARSLITAGIARARRPIDSLAVWPVMSAFLFIFNAMTIAYQEVVIALDVDRESGSRLAKVAVAVGGGLSAMMAAVSLSPLLDLWFLEVSGLTADLMELIPLPIRLVIFVPFLLALISFRRGQLIRQNRTTLVSWGVLVNLFGLLLSVLIVLRIPAANGVLLGAVAILSALTLECCYLFLWVR